MTRTDEPVKEGVALSDALLSRQRVESKQERDQGLADDEARDEDGDSSQARQARDPADPEGLDAGPEADRTE
jgi:hypothetical protein